MIRLLSFISIMLLLLNCSSSKEALNTISPATQWPSFRGYHAAGIADGQNLPDTWNGETMENVKWKTAIPGLAHSSPIVWGDHIFVTSAISSLGQATFKHGLYGAGTAAEDRSLHQWKLFCLNKKSGEMIWEALAVEAPPIDKRHIKATYANSTPATDGRYIVAFFGSQGLFAFDMTGKKIWQKDLGRLDVGAYDAPEYEWGSASSPIIYKDLVIVQADHQGDSFILACDIHSGKTIWKTPRDEQPSWGTPTIYPGKDRVELITNGSKYIRSYNPVNGEELWRLGGSSNITAPTPIYRDDIIIVTSGRRPQKPIFAIKPGGSGDISLAPGDSSNTHILWHKTRKGPYMPTPLICGDYVYMLLNQGILDCYELKSGRQIYRQRIAHGGSGFSGSPVAADGRLYLPGEDGDIFVVRAGPQFELLAENSLGELIMTAPAISGGMLYIRARDHLFAIGE